MRPRSKNEKEVDSIRKHLPFINGNQVEWASVNGDFEPFLTRSNASGWCSECGGGFDVKTIKDGDEYVVCPHCGKRLKVRPAKKGLVRTENWYGFFGIVTVCRGWQVVRYFLGHKWCWKGKKSRFYVYECVQRWYKPNQKVVNLELNKLMFGAYCSQPFCLNSSLSFKSDQIPCYIESIYPVVRLLPQFRRMGVRFDIDGIYPHNVFESISIPMVETMVKTGDEDLIKYAFTHLDEVKDKEKFAAYRICLRRGYEIKDPAMYFDYISTLIKCKVDVHNPRYACPDDLEKAHDEALEKEEKVNNAKKWKSNLAYEKVYVDRMKKFFDLEFSKDDIRINVLKTIKEFRHEGNVLHHCVYKHEYFKNRDSIILSAKVNGRSTETIEVSLKNFRILQCHGDHNQNSAYHFQIVSLIHENMGLIKKYSLRK